MRNVSYKFVDNTKTHILQSIILFSEKHTVYKIILKNMGGAGQTIETTRRMRFICRIIRAINKYSEWVIIISFPLQQWLHQRPSLLLHTYIACLVVIWSEVKWKPHYKNIILNLFYKRMRFVCMLCNSVYVINSDSKEWKRFRILVTVLDVRCSHFRIIQPFSYDEQIKKTS